VCPVSFSINQVVLCTPAGSASLSSMIVLPMPTHLSNTRRRIGQGVRVSSGAWMKKAGGTTSRRSWLCQSGRRGFSTGRSWFPGGPCAGRIQYRSYPWRPARQYVGPDAPSGGSPRRPRPGPGRPWGWRSVLLIGTSLRAGGENPLRLPARPTPTSSLTALLPPKSPGDPGGGDHRDIPCPSQPTTPAWYTRQNHWLPPPIPPHWSTRHPSWQAAGEKQQR